MTSKDVLNGSFIRRHWRWFVFASTFVSLLMWFYGLGLSRMDGTCVRRPSGLVPLHCRVEEIVGSIGFVASVLGTVVLFADGFRMWWKERT